MHFALLGSPLYHWVHYLWRPYHLLFIGPIVLLFTVSALSLLYLLTQPDFRQKRAMVWGAIFMPWVYSALILLPVAAHALWAVATYYLFPALVIVAFSVVAVLWALGAIALALSFHSWAARGPFSLVVVANARGGLFTPVDPETLALLLDEQYQRSLGWKWPAIVLWLVFGVFVAHSIIAQPL